MIFNDGTRYSTEISIPNIINNGIGEVRGGGVTVGIQLLYCFPPMLSGESASRWSECKQEIIFEEGERILVIY